MVSPYVILWSPSSNRNTFFLFFQLALVILGVSHSELWTAFGSNPWRPVGLLCLGMHGQHPTPRHIMVSTNQFTVQTMAASSEWYVKLKIQPFAEAMAGTIVQDGTDFLMAMQTWEGGLFLLSP